MNIINQIISIIEKEPEKIFATLIHQDKEVNLSYKELLKQAYITGQYLKTNCNIQKNDVVIIILKHSIELLTTFIGCMTISAIPTIIAFPNEKINIQFYKDRINDLLKVSKGKVIITYPELLNELNPLLNASIELKKIISPTDIFNNNNINSIENKIHQNQIALLQHSSGTTGHQKGVALSHQAIINQVKHLAKSMQLKKNDVIISWLPLYHDMGLIGCFLFPLLTGTRLIMMSPFDWVNNPVILLKAITQYKGTICFLPNFSYNFMANEDKLPTAQLNNIDLSSMRAFINCSEPVKKESHNKFYKRYKHYGLQKKALCASFALAENTFAATLGGINNSLMIDKIDIEKLLKKNKAEKVKDKNGKILVSSGQAIENTSIKILDNKKQEVAERILGEIALKSDCMLTEYYHRPEITKKVFHQGWYLTGDIGYLANNHLFVIGRKKDIIIVGGKNIYPEDIELSISEVDGIHPGRVVVFGMYDKDEGTEKIVVAAETDKNAVKGFIKKEIKKIVVQETGINVGDIYLAEKKWLLKTSSGKISRIENRKKYLKEKYNEINIL